MSAFGVAPFTPGPNSRPGIVMTLVKVIPVSINEAIAFFDDAPRFDPLAYDSAANPASWVFGPVDTSIESTDVPGLIFVPAGDRVPQFSPVIARAEIDEDDPTQVHIFTDAPMEEAVIYEANLTSAVRTTGCLPFDPLVPVRFRALGRGPSRHRRTIGQDPFRDWDNVVIPPEGQDASTWRVTSTGEIGISDSLRKRIYRRIFSAPGEFAHLDDSYGVGIRMKTLARSGEAQTMANRIAAQVRQEPDVATASVSVSVRRNGLVRILIAVVRRQGQDFRFVFEFPPG